MLSKYFDNTKDKEDFGIAVVVIILAGILIGYFSLFSDKGKGAKEASNYARQNSPIDTLQMDGKTYVAVSPEEVSTPKNHRQKEENLDDNEFDVSDTTKQVSTNELSENTEARAEEEPADTGMDDDDVGMTEEVPDLLDSIIADEKIIEDVDLADEEADSQDIKNNQVVDEATSPLDAEKRNPVAEGEVKDQEAATPKKQETKKPVQRKRQARKKYDCIIVIGAYGNQSSIKKLIGRLDRDGYAIFKVPYKGLVRVGVYEACAKSKSTLAKIRSKYADDAFLMHAGK